MKNMEREKKKAKSWKAPFGVLAIKASSTNDYN